MKQKKASPGSEIPGSFFSFILSEFLKKIVALHPPYVNTEKYYDSPFSAQDHHRLREVLSQVKGRFILSYNDHPLIRELYADYRIEGITRTTTLAGKGNNQTQYAELIIRNF